MGENGKFNGLLSSSKTCVNEVGIFCKGCLPPHLCVIKANEKETAMKATYINSNNAMKKILLFASILSCFTLAIII